MESNQYKLFAMGVSTGGPNALIEILKGLTKVRVPILIVQHISGKFAEMLVESLNRITGLHVKIAEEGEIPQPNTVYLSDSGKHMVLKKHREQLNTVYRLHYDLGEPVRSCRPSVDVLFNSLAENFEDRMLIFVGTGMGCDGLDGVKKIKELHPRTRVITQDEKTSVVYGMNKAVVEAGLSDRSMPINEIALYLNTIIGSL